MLATSLQLIVRQSVNYDTISYRTPQNLQVRSSKQGSRCMRYNPTIHFKFEFWTAHSSNHEQYVCARQEYSAKIAHMGLAMHQYFRTKA